MTPGVSTFPRMRRNTDRRGRRRGRNSGPNGGKEAREEVIIPGPGRSSRLATHSRKGTSSLWSGPEPKKDVTCMHPNKWAKGLCRGESGFVPTRPGMEKRNTPHPPPATRIGSPDHPAHLTRRAWVPRAMLGPCPATQGSRAQAPLGPALRPRPGPARGQERPCLPFCSARSEAPAMPGTASHFPASSWAPIPTGPACC